MENKVTTKKKLGVYCRVSSRKQMDNLSLDNQKQRGIQYCESNGYDYEVFRDVISGSKVNRDGLNQLYQKIYDGDLDGIILYEWDRLQRENRELMLQFENLVTDTKCVVIVDNKNRDILGNLSDRIEYEIKNTLSTIERIRLKKRVGEGIETLIKRGDTLWGKVKFGYKNVGKKQTLHTIIDEDTSPIIKEIHRLFNLKSIKTINELRIQINQKYNKNYRIKFITDVIEYKGYVGKHTQKWKGEVYDVIIPQIIDEETYSSSITKLKKIQSQRKGRDNELHILKGLLYCDDCDGRLYKKGKQNKKTSTYQQWYQCKWYNKPQYEKDILRWENGMKCDTSYKGNYISKGVLEEVVWDLLFVFMSKNLDLKEKLIKKHKDEIQLKNSKIHSQKYYEEKINIVEDKKFKLYNEYLDGKIKERDYNTYNRRFDKEIKQYEGKVKEYSEMVKSYKNLDKYDFESVEELMKKTLKLQHSIKSSNQRHKLINETISKIYIKRMSENEYNFKFVLNFRVDGSNSKYNSITLNKENIKNKTYIKNEELYHSNYYIGNLSLMVNFGVLIIKRLKGRKLMLYDYKIKQLGVEIV
jgi:hypothetical protein